MQGAKTTVVIPYWRGARWIGRCLGSLASPSGFLDEVVIVDNSPEPLDPRALPPRPHAVPVTLLRAKADIGFGRACNLGIDWALRRGADVIVLLNQDAYVVDDCLDILVRALIDEPNAFAVAPVSLTYEADDIHEHNARHYLGSVPRFVTDLIFGRVAARYQIRHDQMNASCVGLRAAALRHVGLFDPAFHMYGEDYDLFARAARLGHSFFLAPHARCAHRHANASATGEERAAIDRNLRRTDFARGLKNAPKPWRAVLSLLDTLARGYFRALAQGDRRFLRRLRDDLALLRSVPTLLRHRDPARLAADVALFLRDDFVAAEQHGS